MKLTLMGKSNGYEAAWRAHTRQPVWRQLLDIKETLIKRGEWFPGLDLTLWLRREDGRNGRKQRETRIQNH